MNKRADAIITKADELKREQTIKKTKQEIEFERVQTEENRFLELYKKWSEELKDRLNINDKDVLIDKNRLSDEGQRFLILQSHAIEDLYDAKLFKTKVETLQHSLYATLYHYFKNGNKKYSQKEIDINIEKNQTYSIIRMGIKNTEARIDKIKQYYETMKSNFYLVRDMIKERRVSEQE